ncbi:Glutaredoxin [Mycena indigotica]|uniref:glutathione peroxidase n=1 Tax=Mycena indigotica TaxID=2126181 RepID=A0A8H6T5B2_9AGAR|nr:Glutaredoxin [Mycena indigotica]KAF7312043.1 Glutaredoxin [Mycena indigotica]
MLLRLLSPTQAIARRINTARFPVAVPFNTHNNLRFAHTMSSVQDLVENAIASNKIAIFSKSWCPYCARAKKLFQENFPEETPLVLELDLRDDGDAIQDYLEHKTGQSTVPNVFVNKKQVGGNDKTQAAFKSGELTRLVHL